MKPHLIFLISEETRGMIEEQVKDEEEEEEEEWKTRRKYDLVRQGIHQIVGGYSSEFSQRDREEAIFAFNSGYQCQMKNICLLLHPEKLNAQNNYRVPVNA